MSETRRYQIVVTALAQREINRLEAPIKTRILARIDLLAVEPRLPGVKKLQGMDGYRIRVGDYRIVYIIEDVIRLVTVTRVAHRREIYR